MHNSNLTRRNDIEDCRDGIIFGNDSEDDHVYHNNLINNYDHAIDFDNNARDNGAEGNYYDNYNRTNLDGDGIGDTYLPWEGDARAAKTCLSFEVT